MMFRPTKKQPKTLFRILFIGSIVLLLYAIPGTAQACDLRLGIGRCLTGIIPNVLADAAASIITSPFLALALIINFFTGGLIALASLVMGWVLSPDLIPYVRAPAGFAAWPIHEGWLAMRDFANMGFVIGIVVIAIATILRIESYGMKRTLWRLIIAAILVNFSLIIIGVLVDASNLFIYFFMDRISPGVGWGRALALGLRLTSVARLADINGYFLQADATLTSLTVGVVERFGASTVQSLAGALFSVMFNVILMITLWALTVMFFIRRAVIWICVVLAPLAFLFSVFPSTQKHYHEWWQKLTQQLVFGPAAMFFIWLTIRMVDTLSSWTAPGGFTDTSAIAGGSIGGYQIGTYFIGVFINMMLFGIMIAMLLAGLMTAHKMGGIGGKAFVDAATDVARYPQKIAQQAARRQYEKRAGPRVQQIGTQIARVPGLGWIGRGVRSYGQDIQARSTKDAMQDVDKQMQLYKSWADDALKTLVQQGDLAAALALAENSGSFGNLANADLQLVLNRARAVNQQSRMLSVRPSLAAQPYTPGAAADAVQNYVNRMPVDRLARMDASEYANPDITGNITGNQLTYLAQRLSRDRRQQIRETVNGAMTPGDPRYNPALIAAATPGSDLETNILTILDPASF